MKRIYLFLIVAGLVPLTMAAGQEKKNEQKIKIIIDEGSGEKILIDTIYYGDSMPKTIELKNGKVIVLDKKGSGVTEFSTGEGGEKVFVTVTSDEEGEKKVEKTITVISGDNAQASTGTGKGSVYVITRADGAPEKTVTISSSGKGNATWTAKSGSEQTKFVIAKDGIVVSVESDDEAKAKEIIEMIQKKLDVKVDTEGREIKK